MQLEDYFHSLQQEKPIMNKDTKVHFCITEDNSDLQDFPDSCLEMTKDYAGPTWMEIVEDVLKLLEASYGYSIRNQVYYAVKNPIFDHNISPAPGRELYANVLHDMMDVNPDLNNGGKHMPWDWE